MAGAIDAQVVNDSAGAISAARSMAQPTNKWFTIIQFVAIMGIFLSVSYFTQKSKKKADQKKKEILNSLQVGDTVTTNSGIIGKIMVINNENIILQTGNDEYSSYITILKDMVFSKNNINN